MSSVHHTRRISIRAALIASSFLTFAGAAHAQDTAVPAPPPAAQDDSSVQTTRNEQGDVVVVARNFVPGATTANKTDIPLIETPQSVSVVTRDQIDLLNFTDGQQAVRYTAGVFGENYGPDLRFDFFTVRGFTPKQYIDGLAAPISTTIYSVGVDLYAFQSLELLKGPASVLYGNAPPGGIYNETSRRASGHFGGEVNAKYGSYNYFTLSGTVTGPIADGFNARLTGLYLDRNAEVDHINAKRLMAAPTFTWNIDSRTQFTGLFYYQWDKIVGGGPGFLPVQGTLLPNPNGMISRHTNLDNPKDVYQRHQYGVGYDFSHEFSSTLTFHSNIKWSHYLEETPTGIYDAVGFTNTTNPADTATYFRQVGLSNFTYREQVASFAADNRLDATVETGSLRHKLLVGFDYRNVRNIAAYGFDGGPGFLGVEKVDVYHPVFDPNPNQNFGYPSAYNNERVRQTGVYAQDQIRIGQLFVTLGGRYDWLRLNYFNAPADTKQGKFTWRAGASYVTDSGFAPYISYATSFEPVLGSTATGQPFKPSAGRQWEGGVKYDARGLSPDIKLFATAALFDIKQSNVVSTAPSITPVAGTQSGLVEVYGGEIEFVARIRNQLSINGSYSYNHSRVLQSNFAGEIGQPLPVTPKDKASLFADYTFQKGTLGGFGFGAGVRYTSGSAGSLPGPFNPVVYYGQAATLFDAIVHYDAPHFRIAVNGSNIFDKGYVARCSGPAGCVYGAGRQVIATVTAKF
jgi:iron complex outermembrane receptor protein